METLTHLNARDLGRELGLQSCAADHSVTLGGEIIFHCMCVCVCVCVYIHMCVHNCIYIYIFIVELWALFFEIYC